MMKKSDYLHAEFIFSASQEKTILPKLLEKSLELNQRFLEKHGEPIFEDAFIQSIRKCVRHDEHRPPLLRGVSAVIRCHNEGEFLRAAILSISPSADEIILCLHNNTDDSEIVINELPKEVLLKFPSHVPNLYDNYIRVTCFWIVFYIAMFFRRYPFGGITHCCYENLLAR